MEGVGLRRGVEWVGLRRRGGRGGAKDEGWKGWG